LHQFAGLYASQAIGATIGIGYGLQELRVGKAKGNADGFNGGIVAAAGVNLDIGVSIPLPLFI